MMSFKKLSSAALDLLITSSVFGIWPRFIEPKLLLTTRLSCKIPYPHLSGFKIIQLSDLHFNKKTASSFLKKVSKKVQEEKPDLVLFTGDFLAYSTLEDEDRFLEFLSTLQGRLGSFCVLGNHDYARYVSRDHEGMYDCVKPPIPITALFKTLKRIFSPHKDLSGIISERAASTPLHTKFVELLAKSPFQLLDNQSTFLPAGINIVGLGEWSLGRFHPETAFQNYKPGHFGIVLTHNPDTFAHLLNYPGEIILGGHSHGEQIHLPGPLRWLSKKLTRLEGPYTRGVATEKEKLLYVNRGLGSHKPFRFLSPPELLIITLHDK